jgi:hypothetical protein
MVPPRTTKGIEPMTNLSITLPASFTVTSRKRNVAVETASLSPEIIAQAVIHGLTQSIADAAASALADAYESANPEHGLEGDALKAARKAWGTENPDAVADAAEGNMRKRLDALLAGEWQTRGSSVDTDPLDPYRRAVVREAISKDKESDAWRAYAAIPSDDRKGRDTFLLDLAAKNAKAVDRVARARMEADQAAKAAASGLDIGM